METSQSIKESHCCQYCYTTGNLQRCANCKTVYYCSTQCQRLHRDNHKELCNAIMRLSAVDQSQDRQEGVYVSHLTPKERVTLGNLVGRKCTIECLLDGVQTEALWDTGAQVSVLSKDFLTEHFPARKEQPLTDLLGDSSLDLKAANGTEIPYVGWVDINFELCSDSNRHISIPFLVSTLKLDMPIIGYNVIEEIVKASTTSTENSLISVLSASFEDKISPNVPKLINFLQSTNKHELCDLKTIKKSVIIPKSSSARVSCRANTAYIDKSIPAYFEPDPARPWPSGLAISEMLVTLQPGNSSRVEVEVHNDTKHDITLKGRTVLGQIQLVTSVTPLEVQLKKEFRTCDSTSTRNSEQSTDNSSSIST